VCCEYAPGELFHIATIVTATETAQVNYRQQFLDIRLDTDNMSAENWKKSKYGTVG